MKIFITITILLLFTNCYHKINIKYKKYLNSSLPQMEFISIDTNKTIKTSAFNKKGREVICLFSTDCPHCKATILSINEAYTALDNIHFTFVTMEPYTNVIDMMKRLNISTNSGIDYGFDRNAQLIRYYKIENIPFVLVFNDKNKLCKVLEGQFDIQELLDIN